MRYIPIQPDEPEQDAVADIVTTLAAGGVVIYPTDTCYGIGNDATNTSARERVFRLKRRADVGLSVIIPSLEAIDRWAAVNDRQREILYGHLPGPFTFILENRDKAVVPLPTIAIRVPDHPLISAVARQFGRPFTSTSANVTGQPPAYTPRDLNEFLAAAEPDNLPDLVVSAGKLSRRPPSTIVDLTRNNPRIVRQGEGLFIPSRSRAMLKAKEKGEEHA